MKLRKCGIAEFAKETEGKQIVCFGASSLIHDLCSFYNQFKFHNRITAIADNNTSKHGSYFDVMGETMKIISVDDLKNMVSANKDLALLITVHHLSCAGVYRQLNAVPELEDLNCYIYAMFPFCETVGEIPKAILALKRDKPQIPKIIHYFWVGGNPIPEKNLKCIESWKKHCPEYEIKRWDEHNYDFRKNAYMAEAYASKKWGYASDYARLDIIYQYGGIYLDVDVEIIKSFDDLLCYPAFLGLGQHNVVNTGHGFGAATGNQLIKEMRDEYEGIHFLKEDGSYRLATCDQYQTETLRRHGFTGGNRFSVVYDTVIFPTEFFSPKNTAFGIIRITDHCHSIHHFDNSLFSSQELLQRKANRDMFQTYLRDENVLYE